MGGAVSAMQRKSQIGRVPPGQLRERLLVLEANTSVPEITVTRQDVSAGPAALKLLLYYLTRAAGKKDPSEPARVASLIFCECGLTGAELRPLCPAFVMQTLTHLDLSGNEILMSDSPDVRARPLAPSRLARAPG
jgi:hypothetical protein